MAANKGDPLEPNPIVVRLLEDSGPGQVPLRLAGYVGPSDAENHIRLYRNFSLNEYWDIPRDNVMDVEHVAESRGCVRLTISGGDDVRHTSIGTRRPASAGGLLRGELVDRARAASRGSLRALPSGQTALFSTLPCLIIVSTIICFPDTLDDPGDPDPPI